ncbi:MAG: hypoxanthine phosphoribosyltransferase [Actinomycetota bacterium]|jgi:hypoxanthine phosphoribosyltransferase|nr:hypoxanthine phosphoribosyltransferase [Actinomycetota bacterium]
MRDVIKTLFTRSDIDARIAALGAEIGSAYSAAEQPPILVGVLKGSAMFLADLMRALDIDVQVDFMSISSYGHSSSQSGVVKIVKDLETDITGRDVLIVEDIVDTGLTLNYLRKALGERAPASLRTVTLLDKVARRIVPVPVEFGGFQIEDVFVLGYGLDWQGRYRNVPDLLAVSDISRLASDPSALIEPLFPLAR